MPAPKSFKPLTKPGIEYDITYPRKRYRQLIADLRYLANSGYVRLKQGKPWKDWDMANLLRYFARCVDALRSVRFALIPPTIPILYQVEHPNKDPRKAARTPFWIVYKKAERFMKIKPPQTPEELRRWNRERASWLLRRKI